MATTKKRVTKRTLSARKPAPIKKAAAKKGPAVKSAKSSELTKLINTYAKAYGNLQHAMVVTDEHEVEHKAWVKAKLALQERLKINNLRAPR